MTKRHRDGPVFGWETCAVLVFVVFIALIAYAGTAEAGPSPNVIIERAIDNQAFNLPGAEMKMEMLLRNRRGTVRERKMFSRTLQKGGLNKTLTRFIAPQDVSGTSFLFLERKGRDDDHYMYMPSLKMVKRIVGTQKNARFMGSDFSYADMESRDLEAASYKGQADEKVGNTDCYVIDAIPENKSAYSRIRTWVRKKDFVFVRTQFFDPRGKLLKVSFVKQIKKVGDRSIPTRIKVTNKKTKHSTLLVISAVKLRKDLSEGEFTVRALKKR